MHIRPPAPINPHTLALIFGKQIGECPTVELNMLKEGRCFRFWAYLHTNGR